MEYFSCKACSKFHNRGHVRGPKIVPECKEHQDLINRLEQEIIKLKESHAIQLKNARFEYDKKAAQLDVDRRWIPPVATSELLVGYRIWKYDNGYLRSAYQTEFKWPHRQTLTKDVYKDAGIHAVKDYKKIHQLLKEYCGNVGFGIPDSHLPGIAGSIYMWGEVKEHEIGYLAEFAYPKEFFVGEDFDPLMAMQIEENYGVPVTFRTELSKKQEKIDDGLGMTFLQLPSFYHTYIDFSKYIFNLDFETLLKPKPKPTQAIVKWQPPIFPLTTAT